MTDIREIVRRVQLGEPDRRIARDRGISRNTVAHYRLWAERHDLLTGPLPEPGVLAALVQPAPGSPGPRAVVRPGGSSRWTSGRI